MKKGALFKTSLRELTNAPTRFLSILGIIFLGVAFFAGIGATGPDMLRSADDYYREYRLADGSVASTLGVTEADAGLIKSDQRVAEVQPQNILDLHLSKENRVLRFYGHREKDTLNEYKVVKGRLPQKSGEVALDNLANTHKTYRLGETITIDNQDDLPRNLKVRKLKVVGFVNSPEFIENVKRGNTNVGSGKVDYFAVIPDADLNTQAYSRILYSLKNPADAAAYSEDYEVLVDDGIASLQKTLDQRPKERLNEVKAAMREQLADYEEQLNSGQERLQTADRKLQETKQKLDEGDRTLKEERQKAEEQLKEGQAQLQTQKAELDKQSQQVDQGQIQLDQQRSQLASGTQSEEQRQLHQGLDELKQQVETVQKLQKILAQATVQEAEDHSGEWYQTAAGLTNGAALQDSLEELFHEPTEAHLQSANSAATELEKELTEKQAEVQKQVDTYVEKATQNLTEEQRKLDESRQKLQEATTQLQEKEKELTEKQKEAEKNFADKEKELANGRKQYEEQVSAYQEETGKNMPKLLDAQLLIKNQQASLKEMTTVKYTYGDRNDFPGYQEYHQNADRISSLATVFPIIFFLIAALVSLTTMTRMVEEKRTEIGTYKALGYRNREIAIKFLLYASLAGLLGSLLGLAVGFYLFPTIIINAYGQLYSFKEFVTPWYLSYALIGIAVGLLCTVVVTMLVLRIDLISTPAALMRPKAPKAGRRVLLERITPLWRSLSFIQKVTVRNLFRYKSRMFMTIFGIAGCTSMIVTGFGIRDSVSDVVPLQFEKLWHYQAVVSFDKTASEQDTEDYQKELDKLQGLENHLPINSEVLTLRGEGQTTQDVSVYVPKEPDELANFILLNDRQTGEKYKLTEDGAVIDEKLAQLFDLQVGDKVKLRSSDDQEYPLKVAAIAENYTSHFAYITPGYYEKIFGEEPVYNAEFLLFQQSLSTKQEKQLAQDLMDQKKVVNVTFLSDSLNALDETTSTLNIVVWVLIISAGLLALIVLYNLNNINISERIRELSTIKVLGFYDGEVTMYIYRENILLTIIGIVLGLLLGIVEHRYVLKTVEMDILMFSPDIHPASFGYAALITIFFTILVGIVVYFKLKRVDMIEALKSNE